MNMKLKKNKTYYYIDNGNIKEAKFKKTVEKETQSFWPMGKYTFQKDYFETKCKKEVKLSVVFETELEAKLTNEINKLNDKINNLVFNLQSINTQDND